VAWKAGAATKYESGSTATTPERGWCACRSPAGAPPTGEDASQRSALGWLAFFEQLDENLAMAVLVWRDSLVTQHGNQAVLSFQPAQLVQDCWPLVEHF
jgi:hypothetical protein